MSGTTQLEEEVSSRSDQRVAGEDAYPYTEPRSDLQHGVSRELKAQTRQQGNSRARQQSRLGVEARSEQEAEEVEQRSPRRLRRTVETVEPGRREVASSGSGGPARRAPDPGDDNDGDPEVDCEYICRGPNGDERCRLRASLTFAFRGLVEGLQQAGEFWCQEHGETLVGYQERLLREAAEELEMRARREARWSAPPH